MFEIILESLSFLKKEEESLYIIGANLVISKKKIHCKQSWKGVKSILRKVRLY